jgi:hypothetical protein
MWMPVEVVGRAIQGIDDPEVSTVVGPDPLIAPGVFSSGFLLGQDPMMGMSPEDDRKGCLLRFNVHPAHKITVCLLLRPIQPHLPEVQEMNSGGRIGGLQGGGKKWVHEGKPFQEGSGALERAVT